MRHTVTLLSGEQAALTQPGTAVRNIRVSGDDFVSLTLLFTEYEIDTIYAALGQQSFQITDTFGLPHAPFHPLFARAVGTVTVTYDLIPFRYTERTYLEFPMEKTQPLEGEHFTLPHTTRRLHVRTATPVTELTLAPTGHAFLQQTDPCHWILENPPCGVPVHLLLSLPSPLSVWAITSNRLRTVAGMYGFCYS